MKVLEGKPGKLSPALMIDSRFIIIIIPSSSTEFYAFTRAIC